MYTIKFLDETTREFETLQEVNLKGADFEGANLKGINFCGAKLQWANLKGANLEGANLEGANLEGANLEGANLCETNVVSFSLRKHSGYAHFGNCYNDGSLVKIGCISGSLNWWLEHYQEVGKKEGYTEKEIKLYGTMLNLLRQEG